LENLEFDDLWGKKSHVFQPIPAELDLAKTALDRAPRSPAGLSVRARKRAATPRRLLLLVRSATSHPPSGWSTGEKGSVHCPRLSEFLLPLHVSPTWR